MSPTAPTHAELEIGFEAFVAASRRLERSYEELKARAEALEREVVRLDKLAGLSELALGIAHEIKNPLNGALGFAELLQKTDDLATAKRYSEKIRSGLSRIDEIVHALLAFAHPKERSGRTIRFAECARRAASAAQVPFASLVLRGTLGEPVECGPLETVLTNLLRNSREAAGDAVSITLDTAVRADELVVTIRDDGPGIPKELACRVFEPFVSTKDRGTGLGLALAVRVLGYLGGSIDLINPGQAGACFEVRVPRLVAMGSEQEGLHGVARDGAAG